MPKLNERRMTRLAHVHEAFDRVLHVCHAEWHGIRQCVAYAPGQKLLIPAEVDLATTNEQKELNFRYIIREIENAGVTKLIFQGYSENADQLLLRIKAHFGQEVRCYAVNHVTTVQFDNFFEMAMLARMFMRKKYGQLERIASVKEGFFATFDEFWPGTILNFAPNVPEGAINKGSDSREIYIPLDPGWRKNMHSNYLAALQVAGVDRVTVANFPFGLEGISRLDRLILVGYLRGQDLLVQMAKSTMLLTATLAECQPMTQLEAFSVGTPALTGPLRLRDFEADPLMDLCTTSSLDDPALLAHDAQRLFDATTSDPNGMRELIGEHLRRRHKLAQDRYAEFLGL